MFSVVLPVYNGETWIGEAIDSVIAQTFAEFELIVVCNGCDDNSEAIAKQHVSDDKRCRVLSLPVANKSNALNYGICFSRYQWIAPIDADDIWFPNKLKKQASFIKKNPNVDIVGTQLQYIGSLEKAAPRNPLSHPEIWECFLLGKNPIAFSSAAWKKNIHFRGIGFFNTTHFVIEDYEFWQRCIEWNLIFSNLEDDLVWYRLHGDINKNLVVLGENSVIEDTFETDSAVKARQIIAKGIVDSMYIYAQEIPEEWGLIGHLRRFDKIYPRKKGTPVNSTDTTNENIKG